MTQSAGRPLFRYMSREEGEAVQETGFLRGGRPGRTYWTTNSYTDAAQARSRLALEHEPEVRLEFRITNEPDVEIEGGRVEPGYGATGGGLEWMSRQSVEVEVIDVVELD